MKRYVTECAGCGGTIAAGDKIWVSDIGEESVITHPLAECLKKYIQPEESRFVSEEIITNLKIDYDSERQAYGINL